MVCISCSAQTNSINVQPDLQPNASESPLYANIQHVSQFLKSKPELVKCTPAIQEIIINAWRSQSFYRPDLSQTSNSLFKSVLPRIDALLSHVRNEWCGGTLPSPSALLLSLLSINNTINSRYQCVGSGLYHRVLSLVVGTSIRDLFPSHF
jgi:hypothetical protein